mmetsp:Transcript_13809/g.29497  ORF Transcript_13809/g.29497 Transcript_13809/m.29497 type:complete len:212 (-) Transcript_13809:711-1346(-)
MLATWISCSQSTMAANWTCLPGWQRSIRCPTLWRRALASDHPHRRRASPLDRVAAPYSAAALAMLPQVRRCPRFHRMHRLHHHSLPPRPRRPRHSALRQAMHPHPFPSALLPVQHRRPLHLQVRLEEEEEDWVAPRVPPSRQPRRLPHLRSVNRRWQQQQPRLARLQLVQHHLANPHHRLHRHSLHHRHQLLLRQHRERRSYSMARARAIC